jgi:hypothetical protein
MPSLQNLYVGGQYMTAKTMGFIFLIIILALAINVDAVPSGSWTNLEKLFAQAKGGNPLTLDTSMDSVITVDGEGSLAKNSVYGLNSKGANELQLSTQSTLQYVDGDHVSTYTNGITQTYNFPTTSSISMSQNNIVTGFPENPTSDMSSQMSVLDSTGTSLLTFSSNNEDNAVTLTANSALAEDSSDVDALINEALSQMGFTMTLDDFESLTLGSVQYNIDRTDTDKGITASWGESKNLEVKMDK